MLVALRASDARDTVHYTSPHTSNFHGKLDQTTQRAQGYVSLVTVCPNEYKLMDFISLYHVFESRVCLSCDSMTDAQRSVSGTVLRVHLIIFLIIYSYSAGLGSSRVRH